jgi:hypothetical protein
VLKHHPMKMCGGLVVELYVLITSTIDGGEETPSRPGRFVRYRWTEGWMGPGEILDIGEEKNISSCLEYNPEFSAA